jgi:hypothetical protein
VIDRTCNIFCGKMFRRTGLATPIMTNTATPIPKPIPEGNLQAESGRISGGLLRWAESPEQGLETKTDAVRIPRKGSCQYDPKKSQKIILDKASNRMSENIPLPNPSIRWGVAPINQASVTSNRGLGNAKDSMAARKIRNRSSMIGQTGSKKLILSRLDPGLRNADAKVSEMIEDRPLTLFLEMGDSK